MPLHLTQHAIDRWSERVDPGLTPGRAAAALRSAAASGVPLPPRIIRSIWCRLGSRRARRCTTYLVSTRALLVVRSGVIVTVFGVSEEQFASLVVWAVMGRVPQEAA